MGKYCNAIKLTKKTGSAIVIQHNPPLYIIKLPNITEIQQGKTSTMALTHPLFNVYIDYVQVFVNMCPEYFWFGEGLRVEPDWGAAKLWLTKEGEDPKVLEEIF